MTWEQVETLLIVWALAGFVIVALMGLRPFLDWWESDRQPKYRAKCKVYYLSDRRAVLSAASMGRETVKR